MIKLTQALGVTPDDLLEWTDIEDKGYLTLLNFSALAGLLFNPLLGIIIPLVMWILKKDKIKFVDHYGKKIISFQITWYLVICVTVLLVTGNLYIDRANLLQVVRSLFVYKMNEEGIYAVILLAIFHFYNLALIVVNYVRINKGKQSWFLPAILFLR